MPTGATGTSTTNNITVDYGMSAESGNITVKGHNICGDGSPQTLGVAVNTIDTSVIVSGVTLSANATSAGYLWIDCNGNTPISGATNQSFTATTNGNYAVIVTKNNCSDTSYCYNISTVEISENNDMSSISFYPNPTTGKFIINSDIEEIASIEIYNLFGEKIYTTSNIKQEISNKIDLTEYSKGIYFVLIYAKGNVYTKKVVIQ